MCINPKVWSLYIFSGTAYHEDIETKTHAATAGENELGKEINWPEDFFFGLPCPKFQYPIIIPPKSRNQLVLFCVKVNSVLQKKIFFKLN